MPISPDRLQRPEAKENDFAIVYRLAVLGTLVASCALVSNFRLKHLICNTLTDQEEVVVVTTKQYLAVADDFLRRLFPEITLDLVARAGAFTVFITDDDPVLH